MRNNPTRRGDFVLDRCLCGYSRKLNKWVRNGCKRHPKVAREKESCLRANAAQLTQLEGERDK